MAICIRHNFLWCRCAPRCLRKILRAKISSCGLPLAKAGVDHETKVRFADADITNLVCNGGIELSGLLRSDRRTHSECGQWSDLLDVDCSRRGLVILCFIHCLSAKTNAVVGDNRQHEQFTMSERNFA